jgi:hypothetical protein
MEFGLDAVFVANSLHVRPGGEGFDDAHPPRCSRDAKPLARRCRRSPGSSKTLVVAAQQALRYFRDCEIATRDE